MSFALSACSTANKLFEQVRGSKKRADVYTIRWIKNLDPVYQSGNLPISLSGPFGYEGLVFAGDGDGRMNAFNLYNGRPVWQSSLNESLKKKKIDNADKNIINDDQRKISDFLSGNHSGFHSAPGVFNNRLIYGNADGRVYSREVRSGKEVFAVDLGSPIETAPTFHQGRVLFQLRNHKLVVLDSETGKILWTYQRSVSFNTSVQRASKPVVSENIIYVGFADGFVAAFGLEDGRVLWERKINNGTKFIDADLTPMIDAENLYVGSVAGPLMILDPLTGTVRRTFDFNASRTPLLLPKDQMGVGTWDGQVIKIDKSGNIIFRRKISDFPITGLIFWKNSLVVGTANGMIHFLELEKLSSKAQLEMGSLHSALISNMQVIEDHLLIQSARNRLYVLK
jgi:outer membrane protein assembly factor BamB